MATPSSRQRQNRPNTTFRQLRGSLSPSEFASAVRRAAREIGEQVSCDARYVGRVESGEIKCPNYAYERVFLHMFPGHSLRDLGFRPREEVRGRRSPAAPDPVPGRVSGPGLLPPEQAPDTGYGFGSQDRESFGHFGVAGPYAEPNGQQDQHHQYEENNDVLRRAFLTGGPAALAMAALSLDPLAAEGPEPGPGQWEELARTRHYGPGARGTVLPGRVGASEARAVERAVRRIRVIDDQHGADTLYKHAGRSLHSAYLLLDQGDYPPAIADRLQSGAGELAISVGWLAHDSGRAGEARSYYAEALSTARMANDAALEAHAFCNTSFLARDAGRPREAVRAARAGQQAAKHLSSSRLLSLLSMREAGGWATLGDRPACERALSRANHLFAKGPRDADPEWMSFYGEAELAGLEAQCWSALGDHERAAEQARLAVSLQDPHFARNIALFTAELAHDLTGGGSVTEAAHHGNGVLRLLDSRVRSSRIRRMLGTTAQALGKHRQQPEVADFLAAYQARHGTDALSA